MGAGPAPRLQRTAIVTALGCAVFALFGPSTTSGAGAFEAIVTVDGAAETVFDWSRAACEPENIPDLPARAFRSRGAVNLVLSHVTSYRMTGSSLAAMTVDCQPIARSDGDADPAMFNDREWIASPYTKNGKIVYALVHNEYQGHTHAGQCPSADYFTCWDNSITLAVSRDGGANFVGARTPPGHLVATPPETYDPAGGPSGYRGPSNIVRGRDGYYYALFNVSETHTQREWVCIARTRDLADPGAWTQQEGAGWTGFVNPYVATGPGARLCPPLDQDDIGHALNGSVTWSTTVHRYLLVGVSADVIDGREVWGVYYSFSRDLLDWTRRQLLVELPLPWTVSDPGNDLSYLYPSVLDANSASMSFETMDDTASLYLTRINHGQSSLDRDLIRYDLSLKPTR